MERSIHMSPPSVPIQPQESDRRSGIPTRRLSNQRFVSSLERMILTFVDSRVNVRLIGSFPNETDHQGFES